ncbi:MAG: NUDIX hydrolase [Phycisphaeraceae bacterium]|nr:NUDIX hydrolase [Phycisphaeraceae bacterium]
MTTPGRNPAPDYLASQQVTALSPGRSLRIVITPTPDEPPGLADQSARVEAAWSAMRAANPRLFDAPILQTVSVDAPAATITARIGSYKLLAVQRAEPAAASVTTGTYQLSVTGVIVGRSRSGAEHVLIARRSRETRIYPAMWELAPSGGIDPPAAPAAAPHTLARREIAAALAAESREELGLDLDWSGAEVACLARDSIAMSDDLVAVLRLAEPIDPRTAPASPAGAWEYLDTAWLSRGDAPEFDAAHAHAIIPPTRAVLRHFGWIP